MLSRSFLIQRGYCCGHGCLMCPYIPKHIKGNTNMKKHKVLIVSALEVETQGKLNTYDTLYTGVGKVNATYKLTQFIESWGTEFPYDVVINYGTAGSRKIKKKTLVDLSLIHI